MSRYECRAKSISGEDTATGELEIKSITKIIIDGPKDVTETVEDTIVMKCEVVADLSLDMDVTWKKDNLDFEENSRIQQNDDHSLTIKNLTFDDSGWNVSLFDPISLFAPNTIKLKVFIRNSNRNYKEIKLPTK